LQNPIDIHVGRRMRARREMCGMPQKELAKQLGISFQQVQKYESGANRISASKLWQLCDVLDVVPGYFFEGLSGARARTGQGDSASENDATSRSARQVLDLNQAFQKIPDSRVRRQVVQLVKSLGRS
jgi:transcriptional regulator with XRE-family HTH domain